MSEWKLHVSDETNRITHYKCGLVAGQRVRLKKDLAITCGAVPTGKVYHAGEEWVVLPGVSTDPVLWFHQADGERHTWDDDIASVGSGLKSFEIMNLPNRGGVDAGTAVCLRF